MKDYMKEGRREKRYRIEQMLVDGRNRFSYRNSLCEGRSKEDFGEWFWFLGRRLGPAAGNLTRRVSSPFLAGRVIARESKERSWIVNELAWLSMLMPLMWIGKIGRQSYMGDRSLSDTCRCVRNIPCQRPINSDHKYLYRLREGNEGHDMTWRLLPFYKTKFMNAVVHVDGRIVDSQHSWQVCFMLV